jgi:hypothetical protein
MAETIRRYSVEGEWLKDWGWANGKIDHAIRDQLMLQDGSYTTPRTGLTRVLIYLRVNNRTAINQAEFYTSLAIQLLNEDYATSSTQFFICGSNTHFGMAIRSFKEELNSPDWVKEQALAQTIIQDVKALLPDTKIFSLVGASINHELLVADNAELIVTPWGAGMAKTKWILNRQCFVHTSQWNLAHRSDLRIYEDPIVREGAVPDLYFPEECVDTTSAEDAQRLQESDPIQFAMIENGFCAETNERSNYKINIESSLNFICCHLRKQHGESHGSIGV